MASTNFYKLKTCVKHLTFKTCLVQECMRLIPAILINFNIFIELCEPGNLGYNFPFVFTHYRKAYSHTARFIAILSDSEVHV